MEHIAIDLGSRESQICIRDAAGKIVRERKIRTARLPEFLAKRPPGRVIVETSAEAFFIADAARAVGHQFRIVPATMVHALGVGDRGIKTDERDARKLSEVSTRIDLPSVHLPSELSRQRKALCNSRQTLVETRTKLTNHVRGHLRGRVLVLPPGNPETFVGRVKDLLFAEADGLPEHIAQILTCLDSINAQIKGADQALHAVVEQDPVCLRLMSVPGVGPIIALRFVSVIDEPGRFRHAHDVMSYLGLTPGENSSSTRKQRTGITKAGATDLRFALVQGAWSALRVRQGDPMVRWALKIATRRNRKIAVTALARKLVGILFAIWRDGTTYDPSRGAEAVEMTA